MEYEFVLVDKTAIFTAKGRKVAQISPDSGEYLINADIKAADGTHFDAVLVIDTESSGEHCGTYILLPDSVAEQGTPDFLKQIKKTGEEFFPYRYKYRAALPCRDYHIGGDGWSL